MFRCLLSIVLAVGMAAGPARSSQPVFAAEPPAPGPQPPAASESPACLTPLETPSTPTQLALAAYLDRIEAISPFPDPLIINWRQSGSALCIESQSAVSRGYYEPDSDRIAIRGDQPPDAQLVILVHELRHLEQVSRGHCPSPALDIKEVARLNFAMEADAQAIATLYAWALRATGDPGPWDALAGFDCYADITQRFAEAMADHDDIAIATARAFDQWYASSWRTEAYYISSCSDHLDQLDSQNLPPGYAKLPEGFFAQFCRMPSGEAYDCHIAPAIKR